MAMDAAHAPRPDAKHRVLIVAGEGEMRELLAARCLDEFRSIVEPQAEGALLALRETAPDVVLVDLGSAPGIDLELCRKLRETSEEVCLIVVTPAPATRERVRLLELGVHDCLAHPLTPSELGTLVATRVAASGRASGKYPIDSSVANVEARARQCAHLYRLSPRETEVLVLVASGVHLKEVAARLGCGYATVRTHLRRLTKKLGCTSARDLLVRFFQPERSASRL